MPSSSVRLALLLFSLPSAASSESCGNYCGAWMCAGSLATGKCDYSIAPMGTGNNTCVDTCCQHHDQCCDTDDRRSCNSEMLQCVTACDSSAGSCWYGVIPLSRFVYTVIFELAKDMCCDTICMDATLW